MAIFAAFFAAGPALHLSTRTLLVEFVEFWPGERDIALPVNCDALLRVFTHKQVLGEDYLVEDASHPKTSLIGCDLVDMSFMFIISGATYLGAPKRTNK